MISAAAALRDVEIATRSRRLADSDAEAARTHQTDTIRKALAAGVPASDVARAAEVSRQRIHQLQYDRPVEPGTQPPEVSGLTHGM